MDLEPWNDFFVATAGAAAGLAGLIIVAMSVNIETIVKMPALPSRAGSTIANLVLIVIMSVAGLIPALNDVFYALIVLVAALAALALAIDSTARIVSDRGDFSRLHAIIKSAVLVGPVVLAIVGGVLLLASQGAGLYLIAASIILAFVGSVVNAWVLLVEIRR